MGGLTDVAGVWVGHATDRDGATGCTVVLCPDGARCAVDVRGGAPGTRETDLLGPGRLVQEVHAICLAGGSAFGLAAADGVMRWLEERGVGFDTAFFNRPLAAYDVDINDDGSVDVTDLVGDGGHDHLTGIERLVFGNGDTVIDV